MTNKMKSVGEALQGFLETAVPSPLSAEERERLRLYNPTLAAQIDALDWKDVPSFIVAIITTLVSMALCIPAGST